MSHFITTILYQPEELNQEILFYFLKNLPEKLQAPEVILEKHFFHIQVKPEVSAVFYIIQGLNTKMKCFNLQCELFREESLLYLIKEEVKKQQERFCLYSHLYCDMDGFEENLKLKEQALRKSAV